MSTHSLTEAAPQTTAPSRWQSLFTQETMATAAVSLIVAAAVILPLAVLVVSSFRVLDPGGFDTVWGLDN
jgi:hypothetical protein